MSSDYTMLAVETEKLHKTENEMYAFYSGLLKRLIDPDVKKTIKTIRDQEEDHIRMVTELMTILGEYIAKG